MLTGSGWVTLYHRTTVAAARSILAAGWFVTRENDGMAYFSTVVDGAATGYGTAVVEVSVPLALCVLDDEFPDGEMHYRVPVHAPRVVGAFTVRESASGTAVRESLSG